MFRKKAIKLSYLLAIGIIASIAYGASKGFETYVPKVIIETKWQKKKEKFVPIEADP